MSEPTDLADLAQVVAGLERRLRRIETVGGPRVETSPPGASARAAADTWLAVAKDNAWSLVYGFIGLVDLAFALRMHDGLLLCGALAMFAFAWLSWRGVDVGP